MPQGRIFVFEGPDGVGKTSLSKMFALHLLEERGDGKVVCTSFPGREKGTLGRLIYNVHHNPEEFLITDMCETSLQILHIAAHIDALHRLGPLLDRGYDVVLDRYWWSPVVYGALFSEYQEALELAVDAEMSVWETVPRPTFICLIDRDTSLKDDQSPEDWQELRVGYKALFEKVKEEEIVDSHFPSGLILLENNATEEDAFKNLIGGLDGRIISRR